MVECFKTIETLDQMTFFSRYGIPGGLIRPFLLLFALLAAVLILPRPGAGDGVGDIVVLTVSGPITPSVAEYIELGFEYGSEKSASMILIELDTPGGLVEAMRSINQEILNSPVPVVVFVSPSGARAASAGTFITLAADVAAMAPGTTIGAAHPVQLMGKGDETMAEKALNDMAAYIRSLAERHGRNGEWAEKAVRESVSITESEALEEGVIDLVAADLDALLLALEGREIRSDDGPVVLETEGKQLLRYAMDLRRRILNTLSNPNIAYLLLMLGMMGIFFELSNPGSIYPGVIGVIAIIMALYSLQTLPVSYAGLLLIALAVVLFVAEVLVAGFGLLALGGVVSLFIGSIMLVRSPADWLRISLKVIVPTVAFMALFFLVVLQRVVSTYRRRPSTGLEGIVGEAGEALEDLATEGRVFVRGEIWNARSSGHVIKGDPVRVTAAEGLMLTVEKEEQGG
jgi:membrane-bound serine protease (ClpP class)